MSTSGRITIANLLADYMDVNADCYANAQAHRSRIRYISKNKKLRYREEHSASVLLSWCTL